jgi:hypothetical protein
MPRPAFRALPVLFGMFALFGAARVAEAQLTVNVNSVEGRDVSERPLSTPVLFNRVDCTGDKELELTIGNIPAGTTVLDFWRGTGCNDASTRTSTTSSACTYLFSLTSFMTPAAQLWNDEIQVADLGGCVEGADNTNVEVFILAATMERTPENITTFAQFSTRFDLVAPAPPTDVVAGTGNTAAPISWTRTTGTINGYRVYLGTASSGEAGACGGGLVAGELPPAGATVAATVSGTAGGASLDLAALGLAVGESASVGVVARDAALNEGVLSELACVTRVETCGYLCQRGGEVATCSVGAVGARDTTPSGAGLGLAALAGLLAVTRRSRRRSS